MSIEIRDFIECDEFREFLDELKDNVEELYRFKLFLRNVLGEGWLKAKDFSFIENLIEALREQSRIKKEHDKRKAFEVRIENNEYTIKLYESLFHEDQEEQQKVINEALYLVKSEIICKLQRIKEAYEWNKNRLKRT